MTTPTQIKRGTADWWVLQSLRDFGSMPQSELFHLGTHETPAALKRVRQMNMVVLDHDKRLEITPKGRNALTAANGNSKPRKASPAEPRTLVNSTQREFYDGSELAAFSSRPGAMDAFQFPSLISGVRRWRDGRVEVVQ